MPDETTYASISPAGPAPEIITFSTALSPVAALPLRRGTLASKPSPSAAGGGGDMSGDEDSWDLSRFIAAMSWLLIRHYYCGAAA